MSFRTKFILILLSATLTMYTVVGGWISTRAQQPANDPNAQLRIFESVLQHIQNDYVDEPNMDKVRAGALRGLAYGLDGHDPSPGSPVMNSAHSLLPSGSRK